MKYSIFHDSIDLQFYVGVVNTLGVKGKYPFDVVGCDEHWYAPMSEIREACEHPENLKRERLRAVALACAETPLFGEALLQAILDVLVTENDVWLEVVAWYECKKHRDMFERSLLQTPREKTEEYVFSLVPFREWNADEIVLVGMLNCLATRLQQGHFSWKENALVYVFLAGFGENEKAPVFYQALRQCLWSVPKIGSMSMNQLLYYRMGTFDVLCLHYFALKTGKTYAENSRRVRKFAQMVVQTLCDTPQRLGVMCKEVLMWGLHVCPEAVTTVVNTKNYAWAREELGSMYPRLLACACTASFYRKRFAELSREEAISALPYVLKLSEGRMERVMIPEVRALFREFDSRLQRCYTKCEEWLTENVAKDYKFARANGISRKEDFELLQEVVNERGMQDESLEPLVCDWDCGETIQAGVEPEEVFRLYEEYLFYWEYELYENRVKQVADALEVTLNEEVTERIALSRELSECDERVVRALGEQGLREQKELVKQIGEYPRVCMAVAGGENLPDCDLYVLENALAACEGVEFSTTVARVTEACSVYHRENFVHGLFRELSRVGAERWDELFAMAKENFHEDCFSFYVIGSLEEEQEALEEETKLDEETDTVRRSHEETACKQFCVIAGLELQEVIENWQQMKQWIENDWVDDVITRVGSEGQRNQAVGRFVHALFTGRVVEELSRVQRIPVFERVNSEQLDVWFGIVTANFSNVTEAEEIGLDRVVSGKEIAVMCEVGEEPAIFVSKDGALAQSVREVGLPVFVFDEHGAERLVRIGLSLCGVNYFPWSESEEFFDRVVKIACTPV